MLKLKLQYFGHLMQTAESLEKSLMLGKIEGRKRRGCQRIQQFGRRASSNRGMKQSELWWPQPYPFFLWKSLSVSRFFFT